MLKNAAGCDVGPNVISGRFQKVRMAYLQEGALGRAAGLTVVGVSTSASPYAAAKVAVVPLSRVEATWKKCVVTTGPSATASSTAWKRKPHERNHFSRTDVALQAHRQHPNVLYEQEHTTKRREDEENVLLQVSDPCGIAASSRAVCDTRLRVE